MSQEFIFQFLRDKQSVSREARKLLTQAIEAGCRGSTLKSLSSFIEEVDNEITLLSVGTNQLNSTGQAVGINPAYLEKLTKHSYWQPPNKDSVTLNNQLNQNE